MTDVDIIRSYCLLHGSVLSPHFPGKSNFAAQLTRPLFNYVLSVRTTSLKFVFVRDHEVEGPDFGQDGFPIFKEG